MTVWMFKQKAGALRSVDLDEISGVDDPANLQKGWLVMKSTDDGAASRAATALREAESVFDNAPDNMREAAKLVFAYLQGIEPSITDQLPDPVSTTKAGEMNTLDLAVAAALNGHRVELT